MAITCPLCNSAEVKNIFNKKKLSFFKCRVCDFIFLVNGDNPNFRNELADFEPAYYNYFEPGPADKKNHLSLLNWIRKYNAGTGLHLLDVGCGSGKWVNYLHQQGFVALGIEPSAALYNHFLTANDSFICTTVNNYLVNFPGKTFDIITAFDVLEHVQEPVDFLTGIASLMHPGSLLFISTPDSGSIHRKVTRKYWHYFNKYHFSYFSKRTLRLAAKKAGLALVDSSYRSRYFQPKYIWQYFKNFILSKKTSYSFSKSGMILPLNLFDNMYCVLKKE